MLFALTSHAQLLLYALLGVLGLVVLVAHFKLHAFLGLILASLFVGLCSGMALRDIATAFQEGVGSTLGFIAVVVGLGTMLGKMLAESGGANVIAHRFIRLFGEQRLHWAMMIVGFIVGLPVFFGVGLVLLVPILFTLSRDTKKPLLWLGLPVVAGLSVSHGLVPPHPGALAALERLHADIGKTILFGLAVGFPTAIVAGPLFGSWMGARVSVEPGGIGAALIPPARRAKQPGFGITVFTILLPVLLMLLATLAQLAFPLTSPLRAWAEFVGSPMVALLTALFFSFYSFGLACGIGRESISKFMEDCLGPAAGIMLVVGAGGGFSKVLQASGADSAIANLAKGLPLSPLVLGWLVATSIRLAVGSATVTMTLAASLLAPVAVQHPETRPELLVLAIGSGALFFSHLNDGGFWLVKEYLNLTVPQTLRTWSVLETFISIAALAFTLVLDAFV
jgi:GntP family gluconate:H+ symporter